MRRRGWLVHLGAALVAAILAASALSAGAQLPPLPPLDPPEVEPSPSPSPSPSPGEGDEPPPPPPPPPPPSETRPAPPREAPPSATVPPPPVLVVPDLVRSPSRTTARLLEIVTPLTDRGIPLETAMIRAAPPFPVAGYSWFTDDWMFPRFVPFPHLHEGTDIFAEAGTPIVASTPGHVAAINTTPVGGNVVWIVADDGDTFYYAHLLDFPEGLAPGARVEPGTVIGFVGNTGNAITTPPHLHLEVHPAIRDRRGTVLNSGVNIGPTGIARSRTPPVNPKPYLDRWLVEAEANARAYVAQTMERLAGLARQIHFSQRIDDIYSADHLERAADLLRYSGLQPSIGSIGLARSAALAASVPRTRTAAQRSEEEQRLAALRLALQSIDLKVAALFGELEGAPRGRVPAAEQP